MPSASRTGVSRSWPAAPTTSPPPMPPPPMSSCGNSGVSGDYLLTVGTLEPRKNVDRLVQAFRQMHGSLPGPWPLVIVGPTGWGPGPAATREVDHVVFTGGISDAVLAELYRRARAFVYVPLTEGYGLPPLEAMRLGIPTVVSDEVPSVHDLGSEAPAPALRRRRSRRRRHRRRADGRVDR